MGMLKTLGGIFGVLVVGSCVVGMLAPSESTGNRTDVAARPATSAPAPAVPDASRRWVTSDRLNRRTCSSTECGVVGQFFYREAATVAEIQGEWARVTRYYDASCVDGRSEYVDTGNAQCVPENGIVDGQFAEWVSAEFLAVDRPPDPAADASGFETLVADSDDFRTYRTAFALAAQTLIESRRCTEGDFAEQGGWWKSTSHRDRPIYFMYCGGMTTSNRLYLNAATGEIFR